MLAAAAVAGTVLISIPFLVLGMGGDDDEGQKVRTAPVGGTTFDHGTPEDPPAVYEAESPSPSPSSASPSVKTKAVVKEPVIEKAAPSPRVTAEPTTETKKKPAASTARELANALSQRVNVQIKSAETGKCADIPGFEEGKPLGLVQQYSCRPTTKDNQLWDFQVIDKDGGPGGASIFMMKNRRDGLCVAAPGNVVIGTKLIQNHCNSAAPGQLWWLEPRPGALWFRHAASNLCLAVDGGRAAGDDARLKVVDCGDTVQSAERWSVVTVTKPSA
ncbi:ricin-type beta-trefoil lectin domain protein [Streptomyces sp. CHD11]|uniref:RICIN domain-containing protein n=1 Tax=Streptomyces sp. CHD11 TaxID=2741325 RepID=UPI001BFC0345|nr:RICIN domain-containing protein [Streptomyces sp. CHD11]MBT3149316.1 ricin-type beta-trefoil lectin domain protein [Streptomyces sp. CHD11]